MYFPRLYELREDHDLTQKKIAEYLTMHPEVYRRYEAGIREIPVWAVIRLAELYHVSTDYLLGLTDEKRTAMRKAALLCGTLSLAVFVSFISCRRAFCSRRRASARFFPRFRCCFRAERAGPARISRCSARRSGYLPFFVQEHFLAAPSDALAGEKRVISVRVTDYPDIYDTSEYLTVLVTDPELPGVKCRIASYDTENFTALTPGDELSIPVKLLPARERNGQSVDTYAAQGIFLRATATGAPEITGRWDFSFLYAPKALCRAIGGICRNVFPPDVQPFLTALLTGDKTDLYDDGAHYYALADAGLAHVVAVSGMHIAFLMGFLSADRAAAVGGRGESAGAAALLRQ